MCDFHKKLVFSIIPLKALIIEEPGVYCTHMCTCVIRFISVHFGVNIKPTDKLIRASQTFISLEAKQERQNTEVESIPNTYHRLS